LERFLDKHRLLILEDDYLAALDLQQLIEDFGGTVVGPVGRLEQAVDLSRSEELDGAILDVRLNGSTSYPLARELIDKGVPVIFLTGFAPGSMESEFNDVPLLSKPLEIRETERVLRKTVARPRS